MPIIINNQDDLIKYYDNEKQAFLIKGNLILNCDVKFEHTIIVKGLIKGNNINAYEIRASELHAKKLTAYRVRIGHIEVEEADIEELLKCRVFKTKERINN